jgi:hypothetical protein
MEDDNIPYEGTSWPIAGFTDKDAAETWCVLHTAEYLKEFEHAVEQGKLAEAEEATWPDDITREEEKALYDALWKKYRPRRDEWENKHTFYVYRQEIPLNPAL